MGDHLFDALLAVREAEESLFADRSRAETVDATRRRY
jgi:glutamine synthetase